MFKYYEVKVKQNVAKQYWDRPLMDLNQIKKGGITPPFKTYQTQLYEHKSNTIY